MLGLGRLLLRIGTLLPGPLRLPLGRLLVAVIRLVMVTPEYQEQRHNYHDSKYCVKHTAKLVILCEKDSHH